MHVKDPANVSRRLEKAAATMKGVPADICHRKGEKQQGGSRLEAVDRRGSGLVTCKGIIRICRRKIKE